MSVKILVGDALTQLRELPDCSVQMCVTSPPYYGLRDYGHAAQIGLEKTPTEYVEKLVGVFQEVRRVLRDDGTLWLNIGDSYAASQSNNGGYSAKSTLAGFTNPNTKGRIANEATAPRPISHGCKPKDLIGIPWLLAFALRADGWYLRSDIIWSKPNPMPESVTDRPTKSHEYLFLLSKSGTYFYDAEAIKETAVTDEDRDFGIRRDRDLGYDSKEAVLRKRPSVKRGDFNGKTNAMPGREAFRAITETRNRRSVWTVTTQPYAGAHFATFPPKLIEPCIKAGSKEGDTVLDPFFGAGTTGLVADRLGRDCIGIELNPAYAELARTRIHSDNPLFTVVA